MKDKRDTRTQLREAMDTLCLKLVKASLQFKGQGNNDEWRQTIDTATKYLSMANREPQESEGGDFARYRSELSTGVVGGGGAGAERDPDAEPNADDSEDGEPAEPADGADRVNGHAPTE